MIVECMQRIHSERPEFDPGNYENSEGNRKFQVFEIYRTMKKLHE
jgi:hypothetical protein